MSQEPYLAAARPNPHLCAQPPTHTPIYTTPSHPTLAVCGPSQHSLPPALLQQLHKLLVAPLDGILHTPQQQAALTLLAGGQRLQRLRLKHPQLAVRQQRRQEQLLCVVCVSADPSNSSSSSSRSGGGNVSVRKSVQKCCPHLKTSLHFAAMEQRGFQNSKGTPHLHCCQHTTCLPLHSLPAPSPRIPPRSPPNPLPPPKPLTCSIAIAASTPPVTFLPPLHASPSPPPVCPPPTPRQNPWHPLLEPATHLEPIPQLWTPTSADPCTPAMLVVI